MLLSEFIKEALSALEGLYPVPEARSLVNLLCEHELGVKSYTHIIEPQYLVPDDKLEGLSSAIDRLAMGEPIQHIIGSASFCGRSFRVSRDVLIPRPETELLVNEAAKEILRLRSERGEGSSVRVLDLCTGSGCIAWTLALPPAMAEVVAVDVSEKALEVASSQVFGHEIEERAYARPLFVQADILDTEQDFEHGLFNLILSNPPYIKESEKALMRSNVLDYEPHIALFVSDDDPLLFYRAVAKWATRFLRDGAMGIVEINETLGDETMALFRDAGFRELRLIKDFYNKKRFVSFRK